MIAALRTLLLSAVLVVLGVSMYIHQQTDFGDVQGVGLSPHEQENIFPDLSHHNTLQQQKQQQETPTSSSSSSPLCRPRLPPPKGTTTTTTTTVTIKRIYMAHMRKAGGTTLHHYLARVAHTLNLTLEVGEGQVMEIPGSRPDTLYVTHVRDPVQRLKSNFEYEGRWGWNCQWLESVLPKTGILLGHKDNATIQFYTKLLQEQERTDSLDYYLKRDKANNINNTKHCDRKHLYHWCSQNCFTRWLALPQHVCPTISWETLRQVAIDRARQYHLIVYLEFMKKDPHYVTQIEQFFGVPGYDSHSSKDLYCFNETKLANRLVPYTYSNHVLEQFQTINTHDYQLLQNLTFDCPTSKDVVFPLHDLRSLVPPIQQ